MPLGSGIVPEHSRLRVDIHHTGLRKTCALSWASPSTTESEYIRTRLAVGVQSGRQECYTRSDDGRGICAKTFACDRMEDTTRHLFRDLCLRCGALDQS